MPDSGPRRRQRLVANQDRALIARRLSAEMAKRGLTQARLGDLSAYDERTIRNILKGLPVRDATLFEVCASLQIDLAKLPLSEPLGEFDPTSPAETETASIAVLPFANLSRDERQDYLVNGIVEDIITELSRFSELVVIARNSTFQYKGRTLDVTQVARDLGVRYLLTGSIRHSSERVRIAVQLVNASSGIQRWAERYDRDSKDLFSVQDEVARTIASLLVAHINKAEIENSLNKAPETWKAYDHYLRGADLFASFPGSADVHCIYEARRFLERSIALDPAYARAYALLSATHWTTWSSPLDDDLLDPAALDRAYLSAQRGVQLDPKLPQARGQLGHILLYKREHDTALAEFERACALNPNFCDWRFAATVMYAGEPARATDIVTGQMERDPFYPVNALLVLGQAFFVARRYDEALPPLREAIVRAPDFRPAHLFLTAAYSRLGRLDAARAQAAEVERLDPRWRVSGTPKFLAPFRHRDDFGHFVDSLRTAGLPE
jgi:adenylate cyclase